MFSFISFVGFIIMVYVGARVIKTGLKGVKMLFDIIDGKL